MAALAADGWRQLVNLGSYLLGMATLALVLGASAVIATYAERRAFPDADVAVKWLLIASFTVASLLGMSLALGSFGAFHLAPLIAVALLVLVVGGVQRRRARHRVTATSTDGQRSDETPKRNDETDAGDPVPAWGPWLALGAVVIVAVRWVARLLETFPGGIRHNDVLHYHLPMAADWVQSGNTWSISFWMAGDASAYHPGNVELLHAIGMAAFRNDFASFVITVPFAIMGLAAAWKFGANRGNGPAGALCLSAFLGLRVLSADSGQVLNDVIPMCLLVVALVFIEEASESRFGGRYAAAAGLVAGIAIGAKLTVVVPGVAFALLVFNARREFADVLKYVSAALLGGGYWYLRNVVHTGSPVPALDAGPFHRPSFDLLQQIEASVLTYASDSHVWREYFAPGLRSTFGPAWPVLVVGLLALAVATATSVAAWRRATGSALLAVVALATFASYLLNPQSAAGEVGDPWLFNANQRYAMPALLLGGLAFLGLPAARRHRAATTVCMSAVFVAASLWRPDIRRTLVALIVVGVVVVLAALIVRAQGALRTASVVALCSALVVAGAVAQREYLSQRWTDDAPERFELYEFADELRGKRIAVAGHPQTYPFYGSRLDNEVAYVGEERDDVLQPVVDCDQWWRFMSRFRADYVAVLDQERLLQSEFGDFMIRRPHQWLTDAGAPVVKSDEDGAIYSVDGVDPVC